MRSLHRTGVGFLLLVLIAAGSSEGQEALARRDRQGPVSVTVALMAPPAVGVPIRARISLDTHSVDLDGIKFEEAVAWRTPEGSDIPPAAVEQAKGSGHHREAVVVFAPLAQAGAVRIVVKNVGGVAERTFVWDLPPSH